MFKNSKPISIIILFIIRHCTMLFTRWRALHTWSKPIYIIISFIIPHCTMLFTRWRALHTLSKPICITILFIIRHYTMLFTHWRALHTWKSPKEYGKSFAQNCGWRKSIFKEMDSHSYRNVHEENPLKKK